MARKLTGIRKRHSRTCASRSEGRCSCSPSWEASAWSPRERKRVWKRFDSEAAAKAWRIDAEKALRQGTMRTPSDRTLRQEAREWLDAARAGTVRNRSGDRYKPSVLRSYEQSLENRVLPVIGAAKLSEVTRNDVQDLADRMLAEGRSPSTIRNTIMPLRAIYRRALRRGEVAVNPTATLDLPAVRGKRDRIADPAEAAALIAAVRESDRAVWATAFYAGLRRGELMALDWSNVDLAEGVIRVEHSWDREAGQVAPKSTAGKRTVPVAPVLRDELIEHKLQTGSSEGLAFGRGPDEPFSSSALVDRARTAWRRVGLDGITLQEARHSFASMMIAAGVNAKALSTYMGHANIAITFDRYGHLMPGNEAEAAELLNAYLLRGDTTARLAQIGG